MTLPLDPLEALLTHLRADADLAALVGTRIYGGHRPEIAGSAGSGAALSAALAGGSAHPDLPLADVLVDVRCWGGVGPDGPNRAVAIWRALHGALNVSHSAVTVSGGSAHLLWALEDLGPALLRDPDTGEAFVRSTARVATANAALPA